MDFLGQVLQVDREAGEKSLGRCSWRIPRHVDGGLRYLLVLPDFAIQYIGKA